MRIMLAAVATLALLGGCKKNGETGSLDRDRSGTDTVITSSRVKDTTVVKADTSIDVDTTKKTEHIKDNR
jgi:hypothetical protein